MNLLHRVASSAVWLAAIFVTSELDFTYVKYNWIFLLGGLALVVAPVQADRSKRLLGYALALGLYGLGLIGGIGSLADQHVLWLSGLLLLVSASSQETLIGDEQAPGVLQIGVLGVGLYGLLQAAGVVAPNLDTYLQIDPGSFFGLSNFSIEFVSVAIVVLVPIVFYKLQPINRPVAMAAIVIGALYIAVSGSRAGLVAVGLGLAVGLVGRESNKQLRLLGIASATLAGVLLVLSVVSPRQSDSFRLESYSQAARILAEAPLGVGLGAYPDAVGRFPDASVLSRVLRTEHRHIDPHNEFLRFAVEFGYPGALALLLLTGFLLFNMRSRPKHYQAGLAAFFVLSLIAFPLRTPSGLLAAAIVLVLGTYQFDRWLTSKDWLVYGPRLAVAALAFIVTNPLADFSRAEVLVKEGQDFYHRELVSLAHDRYQRAYSLLPHNRLYKVGYAQLLYETKQYELAYRQYAKLAEYEWASDNQIVRTIGSAAFSQNRRAVVEEYDRHRQRIQRMDFENGLAIFGALHIGLALPQAIELAELIDLANTPDGRLMVAQVYMDGRRYVEAETLLREGVGRSDVTLGLRVALALAIEHQGRLDDASEMLAVIKQDYPEFMDIKLYEARIEWLRGNKNEAADLILENARETKKQAIDPRNESDPLFRKMYTFVINRINERKERDNE